MQQKVTHLQVPFSCFYFSFLLDVIKKGPETGIRTGVDLVLGFWRERGVELETEMEPGSTSLVGVVQL